MKKIKAFEEFVYGDIRKDQWIDSPEVNTITPIQYRTIPEKIEQLNPGEVFVFGSNLQGIHTKGAARYAIEKGWAENNQTEGLSRNGKSYGIITQSNTRTLSISEIDKNIQKFLDFAESNPEMKFLVTAIATGYKRLSNNYRAEEIAPLFERAKQLSNVYLPKEFVNLLK
jgi:hypothetical protein